MLGFVINLIFIEYNKMDYKLITEVEIEGKDMSDYPDFCDAYISYACYDGVEMTEEQLEEINEDSSFVYECVIK